MRSARSFSCRTDYFGFQSLHAGGWRNIPQPTGPPSSYWHNRAFCSGIPCGGLMPCGEPRGGPRVPGRNLPELSRDEHGSRSLSLRGIRQPTPRAGQGRYMKQVRSGCTRPATPPVDGNHGRAERRQIAAAGMPLAAAEARCPGRLEEMRRVVDAMARAKAELDIDRWHPPGRRDYGRDPCGGATRGAPPRLVSLGTRTASTSSRRGSNHRSDQVPTSPLATSNDNCSPGDVMSLSGAVVSMSRYCATLTLLFLPITTR
jgi:hypothetical protein